LKSNKGAKIIIETMFIKQKIINFSKELGFDLVGFTSINLDSRYGHAFKFWLEKKYHADMQYMEKSSPRLDIKEILPNAKTVIVLATNYYHPQEKDLFENYGRVARYAFGRDYHKILKKRLIKVQKFIEELDPDAKTKAYVDTGPILEKAYAEQAGLGVIGKNSCLITKEFGSWVFLSEIITSLDLPKDKPIIETQEAFSICASCSLCIDYCPTKAIAAPGFINANNCISYHTIENKAEIPDSIKKEIKKHKRVYGCDICQEICPHNIRAKKNQDKAFLEPKIAGDSLSLNKILSIKDDLQYLEKFAGSPLMRAKRKGLQRNALILSDLTESQNKQ